MKTINHQREHLGHKRKKASVLIIMLLSFFGMQATSFSDPSFGKLSITDGLSHYSVMSTYQDERGVLWIGTRGGLDQYDGVNIRNYRHIPGNSSSPLNNYVKAITGDKNGHVFVLTIGGISIYDIHSDCFTNVKVNQAEAIAFGNKHLYYALGKTIGATTTDGHLTPLHIRDIPSDISALHVVDSILYIGTVDDGLLKYDLKTGSKSIILPSVNVTCIFNDFDGILWVGTHLNGLFKIEPSGRQHQFRHNPADPSSISSNFIRSICRDNRRQLWVGTFKGLSRQSGNETTFVNYLSGGNSPHSTTAERLKHSSVWSLTCDIQGTLWIGTYFNGLLSYNPENDIFISYRPDKLNGSSLSYPVTGEMAEDDEGRIWIATEGGGLNRLDPATNKIEWFMHNDIYNKSLKYDSSRQCLWVGTHLGGLKKYEIATGRCTSYSLHNDKSNIVCDIEMLDNNTLLLATHDGIFSFDISETSFTPLFRSGAEGYAIALALDLAIDHGGLLWIGGADGGLYCYNFNTRRMKLYSHDESLRASLCCNAINFIYVSPANELWIGTSDGGLDRFDRERDEFIHHTHSDGSLPSDCVFGARQLPDGRLLALTDKALALLDGNTATSYSIGKSVPLSAFNNKAIHLSSDGRHAYVGGIDGLVTFAPSDLKPRETKYNIFPIRLMIDGREITPNDNSQILTQSISTSPDITISPSHNVFGIHYAITDFTHDTNLSPQYRLEGYSDAWLPMPSNHEVSFTNLSPGDYRLHVRGSSEANAPQTFMNIHIPRPIYLQWYMILIYILVTIGLGWWSINTYRRRIAMQQAIALERQRSRSIEELNQNKLRFFINLSNEFRTPLALIMGKIESLMRSPQLPHALLNKVNGAYTNCILMRDMIAELLDFRRYEQGAMNIKVAEHNVVKFLADIFASFRDYAADRGIRFRFNRSNDSLMLWFDPAQLRKVINNLLSNAFKHTEADGEVSLSVRRGDGCVVIEVSDTGCGIPADEIDKIFNRFYQGTTVDDGEWQGIGVGLALSKGIVDMHKGKIEVFSTPGQSASFVVSLPLGHEHFSDEQIASNGEYRQAKEYNFQRNLLVHPADTESAEHDTSAPQPTDAMVIAEGNEQLREMLSDIFHSYFRIEATGDGAEALRLVEECAPKLIISGYNLPGLTGIELCRKVKSLPAMAGTPYVFVTSHSADNEVLEGLNAGADDYVTLPFDVRQLMARCRNLITKHRNISPSVQPSVSDDQTSPMIASNSADLAFLRRAVKVVEENIADSEFSVERFAAAMNVSRTTMFARIKAVTSQTPNDFITSIRMKQAAKLLTEQPETNIADIAYSLGFSSPRYFSRCFKEHFNESPRAYRLSHS